MPRNHFAPYFRACAALSLTVAMFGATGCSRKDALQQEETARVDRVMGPARALHVDDGTPNDVQNLIPGLPSRTIAPASHWMHMDEPEEFYLILDEFLATVA